MEINFILLRLLNFICAELYFHSFGYYFFDQVNVTLGLSFISVLCGSDFLLIEV
jgi:hypothetical protein